MEKSNKTFLQVWDDVIDNHDLDVSEVLIISKVMSFINADLPCYVSNEDICNLIRVKDIETASRRLSKLQKKGYIKMHYTPHPNNPNKTRRYITLTYDNGLTQKSSRVDLKVKDGLIQESRGVDSEVKGVLTFESRDGCLESQSIISLDNTNIKEHLEHQKIISENISVKLDRNKLLVIVDNTFEGMLASTLEKIITTKIEELSLTKIEKGTINDNKDEVLHKLPELENILNKVI